MEIIVIGAGGHGSELQAYIEALSALDPLVRLAGFVDEAKPRGEWNNARILGDFHDLDEFLRDNAARTVSLHHRRGK